MSLRHSALLPIAGLLAVTAAFAIDPAAPTAPPSLTQKPEKARSDSAEARAAADSLLKADTAADSTGPKKLYEYISYPLLQVVTWPLEVVVAPVVRGLIYPVKPPLRYFLNENVIDRTIDLISFGKGDKVMLYPTMNLAPGTGSSVGLTLRYNSVFGRPTERLVSQGNLFVNGDSKFRTYVTASNLGGTGFDTKASVSLTRVKNTSVNQPGTNAFWFYGDSSNAYSLSLGHLVFEKVGLKGTFTFRDNHFGKAPPQDDSLESDFFRNEAGVLDSSSRGLLSNWQDRILVAQIYRDTRINQNIPLAGSQFYFNYHYHLTNAHHDFHAWEVNVSNYYKLGREKYEISGEEEKRAGGLNVKKLLKKIEMQRLKKELFNRKVLALHAYAAQSYEIEGNTMPVYGLQTLGNDTPLRGYGGSRFRDYTVASVSGEYRFPVLRLVDGMVFNEYGIFGPSWEEIDFFDSLRNSWGFGIRVRRPDIFLFRLQLAFHGTKGIQVNMSVDEPF
ncbi:MAG TPA: hypothetical protein VJ385_12285 [Fibrobacteria bacterium]|nr:hypothetical protein [Fibrobacteria bacterium]